MEESKNSLKNDLQDSANTDQQKNEFKFDELNARQNAALHHEIVEDNSFKLKRFVVVLVALGSIWGIGNIASSISLPFFDISENVVIEEPPSVGSTVNENVAPTNVLPPVQRKIDGSYIDYLNALKDANLFETYEGFERQAFYDAGLDVNYLLQLQESGFINSEALPFHEIIAYRNAGITSDALASYKDNGLMDILEFHELIAFTNAEITQQRLFELKDLGFLDKFEFHEIIGFENNGISTDYLLELESAGLLTEIEFFEIIHFWQNEVTVPYLVNLKEEGLLADLAFYEISKMFKNDAN